MYVPSHSYLQLRDKVEKLATVVEGGILLDSNAINSLNVNRRIRGDLMGFFARAWTTNGHPRSFVMGSLWSAVHIMEGGDVQKRLSHQTKKVLVKGKLFPQIEVRLQYLLCLSDTNEMCRCVPWIAGSAFYFHYTRAATIGYWLVLTLSSSLQPLRYMTACQVTLQMQSYFQKLSTVYAFFLQFS